MINKSINKWTCAVSVSHHYRTIPAIRIQVPAQQLALCHLQDRGIVRVDEPPCHRIIIPGLQIVKPTLSVEVIAPVPERIRLT